MKAIALISGGLDSILAARLAQEQGIDVLPVNFKIPFCHHDKDNIAGGGKVSQLVKDNLGKELRTVDISDDFLKMLETPVHGFGSNMNPCIDCKILMLKKAVELMQEAGAGFVITGEVLGQRPMSQHKDALGLIAKNSGLEGLILRPLSARLLPATVPEKEGWISREALLGFSGRSRRPQIELANKFAIREFSWPAGGCLLTDPEFSVRLRDLIAHKELNLKNCLLLKLGRHFRVSAQAKLIVGRNEKEDMELEKMAQENDYLFYPNELTAGPTSLARGKFDEGLIRLSASITCRYCDLDSALSTGVVYREIPCKEEKTIVVSPISEEQLSGFRIGKKNEKRSSPLRKTG